MSTLAQTGHAIAGAAVFVGGAIATVYRWRWAGRALVAAVDAAATVIREQPLASPGGEPVSEPVVTVTSTIASPGFAALALALIERNALPGVQALASTMFGSAVSTDGAKLINDAIALAAKPSIEAAVADIPDAIRFASDLSSAQPGLGLKIVNDLVTIAEKPSLSAAVTDLESLITSVVAVAPATPAAAPEGST